MHCNALINDEDDDDDDDDDDYGDYGDDDEDDDNSDCKQLPLECPRRRPRVVSLSLIHI